MSLRGKSADAALALADNGGAILTGANPVLIALKNLLARPADDGIAILIRCKALCELQFK